MNIEIELKCKMEGNHRIMFSRVKDKDMITIESYQGQTCHTSQLTLNDLRQITELFYNM